MQLEDATIDQLSAELKKRGWRIISNSYAEVLFNLGRGMGNGWFPAIESDKK